MFDADVGMISALTAWGEAMRGPKFLLALLALLTLAGCVSTPRTDLAAQPSGSERCTLATCNAQPARYPEWLIGLADPAAPIVGRTIALIRFRKGYLAGDEAAKATLLAALRPMDTVMVSSKGRLTGHAIPGLFTHTVVYLGTETQLRALGMWQDPQVVKYHQTIQSGSIFIESDQAGVHLSKAETILNTDRVLVLRPRSRRANWLRLGVTTFLEHVGSRFDFNFDAGENRRLYCSELVFHILPELQLPVRHFYHRDVVLPDDIAATGLERGTALTAILYLRGQPDGWQKVAPALARADIVNAWSK